MSKLVQPMNPQFQLYNLCIMLSKNYYWLEGWEVESNLTLPENFSSIIQSTKDI